MNRLSGYVMPPRTDKPPLSAWKAACLIHVFKTLSRQLKKSLKAVCLSMGLPLKKTHSIGELRNDLLRAGLVIGIEDDDCEFLDSIYLPSKYPLGSALPDFEPDSTIALRCLDLADRIIAEAVDIVSSRNRR